jgi:hypothetical protein
MSSEEQKSDEQHIESLKSLKSLMQEWQDLPIRPMPPKMEAVPIMEGCDYEYNMTIGTLDFILSKMVGYRNQAKEGRLSEPNRQTLKYHAEDMIAAGQSILKALGVEQEGASQPAQREVGGSLSAETRRLVKQGTIDLSHRGEPTPTSQEKENSKAAHKNWQPRDRHLSSDGGYTTICGMKNPGKGLDWEVDWTVHQGNVTCGACLEAINPSKTIPRDINIADNLQAALRCYCEEDKAEAFCGTSDQVTVTPYPWQVTCRRCIMKMFQRGIGRGSPGDRQLTCVRLLRSVFETPEASDVWLDQIVGIILEVGR